MVWVTPPPPIKPLFMHLITSPHTLYSSPHFMPAWSIGQTPGACQEDCTSCGLIRQTCWHYKHEGGAAEGRGGTGGGSGGATESYCHISIEYLWKKRNIILFYLLLSYFFPGHPWINELFPKTLQINVFIEISFFFTNGINQRFPQKIRSIRVSHVSIRHPLNCAQHIKNL